MNRRAFVGCIIALITFQALNLGEMPWLAGSLGSRLLALGRRTGFVASAAVAESTAWTNLVNCVATSNSIQKTSGCDGCADAGAASGQTLVSGDGYVQFAASETNTIRFCGLSSPNSGTSYANIKFAIKLNSSSTAEVRELNSYKTEISYKAGDVFQVAIVNGRVQYFKNGKRFYTSKSLPAYPLSADASLLNLGATITNAFFYDASAGISVTPTQAALNAGQTQQFSASVQGMTGAQVTWSATGGTISSSGLYTASATTGFYTVTATAVSDLNYAASASVTVAAPSATVPLSYSAITDTVARPEPALPALGPAGSIITDPDFASSILRVSDGNTIPGDLNTSFRTVSMAHHNAWNANSTLFYVITTAGMVVPFSFNPATLTASRIPDANGSVAGPNGGLLLQLGGEPQFSFVDKNSIYGVYDGSGANLRTISRYSFLTGQYTLLLNLDTLVGGLASPQTYVGGLSVSNNDADGGIEKVCAFFGGIQQDYHHYIVVFDKNNPGAYHLMDTLIPSLDGITLSTTVPGFHLHNCRIEKSGRYVILESAYADRQANPSVPGEVVWDTQTNSYTPITAMTSGHYALGYGHIVNQDGNDGMDWQIRSLDSGSVNTTAALINPVLSPAEWLIADHTSWVNAQSGVLVPVLSGTYRYGNNTTPWRAWDNEIIAIRTDGSQMTVWRFAHHRSDVSYDGNPSAWSFWYTPRAHISQDGRFAIFTSNWEKTLGTDPGGEPGTTFRQDVFLVVLTPN